MQYADGSWNTAYYCKTKGVQESAKHVGPALWMAIKAVEWSLQFQQEDGGINLGLDYDGSVHPNASTEHNQDAYPTLKYFGYATDAAEVKSFLDDVVWAGDHWIGGRGDTRDPLDVNSWGVSALGASGTRDYQVSLDYAMSHHRTAISSRGKAYDAFDFNSDQDDIWFEGTGQMVVAFEIVGRSADADFFMAELLKGQQSDGGVPYSLKGTHNGYWKMSTAKCVSSTGWLIFAEQRFNPFEL